MNNYKSPINVFLTDMELQYENEIMTAVQKLHIEVDKKELLKALKYDRNQYEIGFRDGQADMREKIWVRYIKMRNVDGGETYVYHDPSRMLYFPIAMTSEILQMQGWRIAEDG